MKSKDEQGRRKGGGRSKPVFYIGPDLFEYPRGIE